jgi:hypothetical protein
MFQCPQNPNKSGTKMEHEMEQKWNILKINSIAIF